MNRQQRTLPRSEFFDAMRKGVLLGFAVLALVLPPAGWWPEDDDEQWQRADGLSTSPQASREPKKARDGFLRAPRKPARLQPRLASFGDEQPSADARHVANWAVHSRDHQTMSFVVVDKKDARVYVFNPRGELVAAAAALLGAANGDHTVPGVGDKPLWQVLPEEKTTPAGRFIAEAGVNLKGEDIVWVDYDAAVSMHRVRPLVKAEQRLERLASPSPEDNRISFGCINLPVAFYETVLSPAVKASGAVVYVLPETRTPQEVFASYDVVPPRQMALR